MDVDLSQGGRPVRGPRGAWRDPEAVDGLRGPSMRSREIFDEHGVCWGPYQTFMQLVDEDPRCSAENPMFSQVEQPGIGDYLMRGLTAPTSPSTAALPAERAPHLGEHTDEILAERARPERFRDRTPARRRRRRLIRQARYVSQAPELWIVRAGTVPYAEGAGAPGALGDGASRPARSPTSYCSSSTGPSTRRAGAPSPAICRWARTGTACRGSRSPRRTAAGRSPTTAPGSSSPIRSSTSARWTATSSRTYELSSRR